MNVIESSDMLLGPGSRFTPDLVTEYRNTGLWRDVALGSYLDQAARQVPASTAAISVDTTGAVTRSLTYQELDTLSRRIAAGLRRLGVWAGDTVAVMLPNCAEFSAVVFAVLRLGARYSGIPITYGRREAAFMLGRAQAKALVIAQSHGRRDLAGLGAEIRQEQSVLEQVVVFGNDAPAGPGWLTFDELIAGDPLTELPHVEPFSLAQLAFTSGTTSEPKAVMNLHATLDAMIANWVRHIGADALGTPLVNLVMSPVGHSTGFFWGALMSAYLGGTAVYLERWQPELALRVLHEQRITTMIGSPTFLLDVLRTNGATNDHVPDLRLVALAGAPVPRPLVAKARRQLGCAIVPAWGMTEYGIGLSGSPALPRDRVEATDGRPVPGCEVRVCHADDSVAGPGEEGDLQIRGPGLFAGYYGRPDFTAEAFTSDGWFRTGDRALIEVDGYVRLMGRTKDIVIRGGENIPVAEIENLLYTHPAVTEVAVIGIPDERLGERVCAIVAPKPGTTPPDLPAMSAFLLSEGLSKRFLPERLVVLDELPKTMSGKIRKVELRERYREGVS